MTGGVSGGDNAYRKHLLHCGSFLSHFLLDCRHFSQARGAWPSTIQCLLTGVVSSDPTVWPLNVHCADVLSGEVSDVESDDGDSPFVAWFALMTRGLLSEGTTASSGFQFP
jgi:hypothetical protein